MSVPVLTVLIFLPSAAALGLVFAGRRGDPWARRVALWTAGACLVLASCVTVGYARWGLSFAERVPWVPSLGISYVVGVDGLSVFPILLTAILVFVALWLSPREPVRTRLYHGLFLVLATGLFGVFCSLDLIVFYVFWELVFLPIYFLIAIWGDEGAGSAAMRFLVWMLIGSLVMLLGILAIYFAATPHTFDLALLMRQRFAIGLQRLVFTAFFVAFAVKVPVFPFHTWLPDAYTLAPTPVTAVMSGSLAAMGVYGFWRIPMSLLPAGMRAFGGLVAVLAIVSVIYGDVCATAQRDLKRMTSYSSISHMGLIMFGSASADVLGIRGSVLHTFNHGIAMAAFFFVIESCFTLAGSRNATMLRHLMVRGPVLAGALWFVSVASFGMPGLSTFPGELLIIVGGFERYWLLTLVALVGVVIMAGYIFWVLPRVTLGPMEPGEEPLSRDLGGRELWAFAVLAVMMLVLGFFPRLITGPANASVLALAVRARI